MDANHKVGNELHCATVISEARQTEPTVGKDKQSINNPKATPNVDNDPPSVIGIGRAKELGPTEQSVVEEKHLIDKLNAQPNDFPCVVGIGGAAERGPTEQDVQKEQQSIDNMMFEDKMDSAPTYVTVIGQGRRVERKLQYTEEEQQHLDAAWSNLKRLNRESIYEKFISSRAFYLLRYIVLGSSIIAVPILLFWLLYPEG